MVYAHNTWLITGSKGLQISSRKITIVLKKVSNRKNANSARFFFYNQKFVKNLQKILLLLYIILFLRKETELGEVRRLTWWHERPPWHFSW